MHGTAQEREATEKNTHDRPCAHYLPASIDLAAVAHTPPQRSVDANHATGGPALNRAALDPAL